MSNENNLLNSLRTFDLGNGKQGRFYSLPALEQAGVGAISRLPVSIRLVLESVVRNCDGKRVAGEVDWPCAFRVGSRRAGEIGFVRFADCR